MDSKTRTAKLNQRPSRADVRPLGTPRLKGKKDKKSAQAAQKVLDPPAAAVIESPQAPVEARVEQTSTPTQRTSAMTLTYKGLSKNGKQAIYTGAAQSVRFTVATFVGGKAPETITLPEGLFAAPKAKKQPLTAEEKAAKAAERKAARKQLTAAERVARAEARLAKLREAAKAETGVGASM